MLASKDIVPGDRMILMKQNDEERNRTDVGANITRTRMPETRTAKREVGISSLRS
jgi:hypothetical protein